MPHQRQSWLSKVHQRNILCAFLPLHSDRIAAWWPEEPFWMCWCACVGPRSVFLVVSSYCGVAAFQSPFHEGLSRIPAPTWWRAFVSHGYTSFHNYTVGSLDRWLKITILTIQDEQLDQTVVLNTCWKSHISYHKILRLVCFTFTSQTDCTMVHLEADLDPPSQAASVRLFSLHQISADISYRAQTNRTNRQTHQSSFDQHQTGVKEPRDM